MHALIVSISLFASPPAAAADGARQTVIAVDDLAVDDVAGAIETLEAALATLANDPVGLVDRPLTLAQLSRARLTLAWLYLAQDDREAAEQAMDAAILGAGAEPLRVVGFGPKLPRLYEQRRTVLDARGLGRIAVACAAPCRVIIDERPAANPSGQLIVGPHRLWVGAMDSDDAWVRHEVELGTPGETLELRYGGDTHEPAEVGGARRAEASAEASTEAGGPQAPSTGGKAAARRRGTEPTPRRSHSSETGPRLLPRWAGWLGVASGLALIGGAALVLVFDGHCRDDFAAPTTGAGACPKIYTNAASGYPLLAAGGAALLGFGAVLTVDEVRGARGRGRGAIVTWTLRF